MWFCVEHITCTPRSLWSISTSSASRFFSFPAVLHSSPPPFLLFHFHYFLIHPFGDEWLKLSTGYRILWFVFSINHKVQGQMELLSHLVSLWHGTLFTRLCYTVWAAVFSFVDYSKFSRRQFWSNTLKSAGVETVWLYLFFIHMEKHQSHDFSPKFSLAEVQRSRELSQGRTLQFYTWWKVKSEFHCAKLVAHEN